MQECPVSPMCFSVSWWWWTDQWPSSASKMIPAQHPTLGVRHCSVCSTWVSRAETNLWLDLSTFEEWLNCQLHDAVTLNDNNSIGEMYESPEHHAMQCVLDFKITALIKYHYNHKKWVSQFLWRASLFSDIMSHVCHVRVCCSDSPRLLYPSQMVKHAIIVPWW